jgi:hypothetical protein
MMTEDAAMVRGVIPGRVPMVPSRRRRQRMLPLTVSGRFLSFAQRQDIALLTVAVCARAVAVLGEDLVQADEA